jgi:hypothetical protein
MRCTRRTPGGRGSRRIKRIILKAIGYADDVNIYEDLALIEMTRRLAGRPHPTRPFRSSWIGR